MSQNFTPPPAPPPAAQPAPDAPPITDTREREVKAVGDSTSVKQPVPVPETLPAREEATRFGRPAGRSLRELLEDADEDEGTTLGRGPSVVILHNAVRGPGGAYVRGQVVRVSKLLGDELFDKEREAKRHLLRYIDIGAIREATAEEAEHEMVSFIEDEAQLGQAYTESEARRVVAETENNDLKSLLAAIAEDPNASAEDIRERIRAAGVTS